MLNNTTYVDNNRMDFVFAVAIVLPILLGLALLISQRVIPALFLISLPFIVIIACHTRIAIYLYLFSLPIFWAPFAGSGILLIDLVSVLLIAAFIIDYLLKYKVSLEIPKIANMGLILVAAMFLSTLFAHYPAEVIGPIARVIFQIILTIILYNMICWEKVKSILGFYFWIMVVHSIFNVGDFVFLGGSYRIFGLASIYFDDLAMLAIPIGFSFFLWTKSWLNSLLYGIGVVLVFFALIATQSRGPLLTALLVAMIMIIMAIRRAQGENLRFVRGKMRFLSIGALLIAAVLIGFSGIFKDVGARYQSLTETDSGTIWLRISLWKASLVAFMSNPLTGIGSGNFRSIDLIFPNLKFDIARLYVMGLSAHNLFLHYLAETGLVGTAAMISYFSKNLIDGRRIWILSSSENYQTAMALAGVGLIIFITIFYLDGWMWRQNAFIPPLFFALTARYLKGPVYAN
jgi:O-antigen ligase